MTGRRLGLCKDKRTIEERQYGWQPSIAIWTTAYLIYEAVTGAILGWAAEGSFRWAVLVGHLVVGLALLSPSLLYTQRHWSWYRKQPTTILTWLGNLAGCALLVVMVSGLIAVVQKALGQAAGSSTPSTGNHRSDRVRRPSCGCDCLGGDWRPAVGTRAHEHSAFPGQGSGHRVRSAPGHDRLHRAFLIRHARESDQASG